MLVTRWILTKVSLLAVTSCAAVIAPRAIPTFMIVGDSISQGRQGDFTWRYRLWEWFDNNDVAVHFTGPYVGTQPQATAQAPSPPATAGTPAASGVVLQNGTYSPSIPPSSSFIISDDLHFAVWGRQLIQDVPLIGDMVVKYQPDYLLVELGFNDVGWFVSDAQGTLDSLVKFINNTRAAKSDLRFVIANIPMRSFIPGRDDLITKTDEYNSKLDDLFSNLSTQESPIYKAQFRENYSCEPTGCPAGSDGLHPNLLGEYQIAKAFADTLHYAYGFGGTPFDVPAAIPVPDCDIPSNIVARVSAAGVTVTWDQVGLAYGYTVMSQFEGGNWTSSTINGPRFDTTWTVAGITWNYQIQSICQNSVSNWSEQVSATANPTAAPGPSNILVTSTVDGIYLSWDAVVGFDVQEYGVIYDDGSIAGSFLSDYGYVGTSANVTGLVPGDHYAVAIETWANINGELAGGLPAGANGVVVGSGEPSAPTNLQVVTIDDGATVQLTWDGDANAYGYKIYSLDLQNASATYQLQSSQPTGTCFVIGYLFPGAWNFELCVTAYNGDYETGKSACVQAPTTISTVADCPTLPTSSAGSGNAPTPTVTWAEPTITTATPSSFPVTSTTTPTPGPAFREA